MGEAALPYSMSSMRCSSGGGGDRSTCRSSAEEWAEAALVTGASPVLQSLCFFTRLGALNKNIEECLRKPKNLNYLNKNSNKT